MKSIQVQELSSVVIAIVESKVEWEGSYCDVLAVREGEKEIARLELFYGTDEDPKRRVTLLSCEDDVHRLPGVCGPEHFVSCVTYTMLAHFSEDHTFYSEVFYSEVDGQDRTLKLQVLGF